MKILIKLKLSYIVLFIVAMDFALFIYHFNSGNAAIYFGMLTSSCGWCVAELKGERLAEELKDALNKLADLEEQSNASN